LQSEEKKKEKRKKENWKNGKLEEWKIPANLINCCNGGKK
jgi:hypothetical protein